MTVACLAAFFIHYTGGITPNAVENTIEARKFALQILDECQGMSAIDAAGKIESAIDELDSLSLYVNKSVVVSNLSEEDFLEALGKYPYLESLYMDDTKSVNDFNRAERAFSDWLRALADDAEHIAWYSEYLEGVHERAGMLSYVGIFNKGGSFSKNNLEKTASDFMKLDGVSPVLGNSSAVERWAYFKVSDYAFLICIAVIALSFVEERKKGLWGVIRSCKLGRLRLGVTRITALLTGSALLTVLFYVLPLVASAILSGGFGGLDRPIQSMAMFSACTMRLSISQWIVVYLCRKVFSGVLIGLLVWCVTGMLASPQFSLGVTVAVFAGEYLLYELIPVQSTLNVLKYLNIFSYVHSVEIYTYYLNVNIFDSAIGIRRMTLFILAALIAVLSLTALLIQCRRYPEGNRELLSRASNGFNAAADAVRVRLTVGGWEAYKHLAFEFGAVILIAVVAVSGSLTYYTTSAEHDVWYQSYLNDASGPIEVTQQGNSLKDYIEKARSDAEGEMNSNELLAALSMLEAKADEIVESAERGGYEPWLIDEQVYAGFYGDTSVDAQRTNAVVAVMFAALCCAGLISYERQSDTAALVKSTCRGRMPVFAAKAGAAAVTGVLIWAAVYLRELFHFIGLHGTSDFAASVQNLSALSDFPITISISGFLAVLYIVRLLMLVFLSFIMMATGGLFSGMLLSCAACVGIFGLPALLVLTGVEAAKYVSPIVPVASAEILWNAGSDPSGIAYWLAMAFVGVVCLMLSMKAWVMT